MAISYAGEFGWSNHQNVALQKYMLLQSQHQSVHEYLYQLRSSTSSSAATSPSMSPTRGEAGRLNPPSRSSRKTSPPTNQSGHALDTVVDETTIYEIAAQEQALFDVNEAIKRSLTELLNNAAVRDNRQFRTWVQGRLMEVEKELRSGRRRRGGERRS